MAKVERNSPLLLGILIFDGVEVLDFCGPFEVFSLTGVLVENSFKVVTIAQKPLIEARNGLKVVPDYVIGTNEVPKLDVLVLPGGRGTIQEVKNESLISWIKEKCSETAYLISVCTGVCLLGKAGFIRNMIVTTHFQAYDRVRPDCPDTKFCLCRRYADNGRILTSAGISAGIDVSIYFVKKIFGIDAAKTVANHMEYRWDDVDCTTCNCTTFG